VRNAIFAIALASVTITAAGAQNPTSSAEFRPNYAADAKIRGAIELDRLVKCAMGRRENLARNIITSRPGSREQNRQLAQFREVEVNCMNEQVPAMWLGGAETRGAIAQTFYLRQYPVKPDFSALPHPLLPLPQAWTKGKLTADERSEVLGADLADCVVAAVPADADALLRTDLRSRPEREAFARLVPLIGPCLPKGLKMELDVAWLRAVVAESLLRNIDQWQNSAPLKAGGSS
jgi:hypothetical protein